MSRPVGSICGWHDLSNTECSLTSNMARILLIDDAEAILETTGAMLQMLSHEVVTAHEGQEGVELFCQQPFDLVITDMRMPGLSGAEVIKALRQVRPGVRIIATAGGAFLTPTGHATPEQLGADLLLDKPYSIAQIKAAVEELLKRDRGG